MEPVPHDLCRAQTARASNPITGGQIRPCTGQYPMSTGHHRLADGSLVRVDFERGHWVGRLYTPDMRVKSQIHGSDAEVHAWANAFVALGPTDSSR
jgi:hypothetical protein